MYYIYFPKRILQAFFFFFFCGEKEFYKLDEYDSNSNNWNKCWKSDKKFFKKKKHDKFMTCFCWELREERSLYKSLASNFIQIYIPLNFLQVSTFTHNLRWMTFNWITAFFILFFFFLLFRPCICFCQEVREERGLWLTGGLSRAHDKPVTMSTCYCYKGQPSQATKAQRQGIRLARG